MRLGIYGGSFNPPHKGHVRALGRAIEELGLSCVLAMPCCVPPHKSLPPGSPSDGQRLEMARLAFEGLPGVRVSDLELTRGGISYTADTLKELARDYPDAELWLVTGGDMLLSIQHWRAPERIFSLCGVAAIPRKPGQTPALLRQADYLREKYGGRVRVIDMEPVDISSSRLRAELARGRGEEYLPGAVADYIRAHGLYRGEG